MRPTNLLAVILLALWATAATGQPAAPLSPREQDLAQHKQAREDWRANAIVQASSTCGTRFRYDDEGLHLQFGTAWFLLRDHIDIYRDDGPIVGDPTVHVLLRCSDTQGLYMVRLIHWEWSEVLLLAQDGLRAPTISLHGAPVPSPDENALVVAEMELGLWSGPARTIQIVMRADDGQWRRVWDHLPTDAMEWTFVGWVAPNRFRILMRSLEKQWESVIEFTLTTLTRTDGPKTPTKSIP